MGSDDTDSDADQMTGRSENHILADDEHKDHVDAGIALYQVCTQFLWISVTIPACACRAGNTHARPTQVLRIFAENTASRCLQ